MAKKQLEGVELANDIMLKEIAAFLVAKKFYGKAEELSRAQEVAKKDTSKRGKLYKLLAAEGIQTKYDLAINHTDACFENFGEYAKVMKAYRAQVIKKSFAHRKADCK